MFCSFFALFLTILLPDQAPPTKLHPKMQPVIQKGRLENGVTVLVISDPSAEKGAAALSVEAGSWDEPEQSPGLAHFLEHMLFLGTKSHPDEDSFGRFLSENNGMTNAFTEDLYTTYLFETNPGAFPTALAHFGEFFSEPLLKDEGAGREMRAVDQEFRGHSQNDEGRRLMVYKELGNPSHPFSRFNFGSSETLSTVKGEELRKWFESHYSANLMSLVLYSPLPADEMMNLAKKNFSTIPNHNLSSSKHPGPLLGDDLHGKVLYVEPIQNKKSMILMWELPAKFANQKEKRPEELLCHVLGHEGKGSLFDHLRSEGLALGISCGASDWKNENIVFLLDIQLTSQGLQEKWRVVDEVFQAIKMIQETPYPEKLFQEIQEIGQREYQYPSRQSAFREVMKHSRAIRSEEIETYPYQSTVIQQFDPKLVAELAAELTPETLYLSILAKGEEFDQIEEWMKVPFKIQEIPPEVMQHWIAAATNPEIHYPSENPFLDSSLALLYQGEPAEKSWQPPTKILPGLYYAPDHYFLIPKTYLSFLIRTPEVDVGDAKKIVLNNLFTKITMDNLQETAYLAKIAGLAYEITVEDFGIRVTIGGFSGKESLLLEKILSELKKVPSESLFALYREEGEKELENFPYKPSYEQAINLFKNAIYKSYASPEQKRNAIEKLTYKDFKHHIKKLFSTHQVEGVVYGNITEEQAIDAYRKVNRELGGTPFKDRREQEIALFPSGPYILQKDTLSRGNGVILAMQNAEDSPKRYAAGEILADLISTPFFNELRTRQQTAYIISSFFQEINEVLLTLFLLDSHTHSSRDLLSRVELFLSTFLEEEDLNERFENGKAGLIAKLSKNEENLIAAGKKIATLSFERKGDFALNDRRLKAAKELTFEEFYRYAQESISEENRKRLAIFADGVENPSILHYKDLPNPKNFQNKVKKWIAAPDPYSKD